MQLSKTLTGLIVWAVILSVLFSLPAMSSDKLERRGFLGVQAVDITEDIQAEMNLKSAGGVIVKGIFPDTTASEGGIKEKDIILEINGNKISGVQDFISIVGSFKAGDELNIKIVRANEEIMKTLILKTMPEETSPDFDIIYTSLTVNNSELRVIITKPFGEGKFPSLFFIPGLSCISVDYPFDYYPNPYKSILYELTKRGFATMRIEKFGMGDSTGVNCKDIGFNEETEGFLKGLEFFKTFDFVDTENIFIFGHSMGGVIAPVIAEKVPVKGVMVYGTVSKVWTEYLMENIRRQEELEGADFAEIENNAREREEFFYHFYSQNLTPEEISKNYPRFKDYFDAGKYMYGRHYTFFQEIYNTNLAEKWKNTDSFVLSIWGEGDFVSTRGDHVLIADIVNRYHPGKGTYLQLKNSDHGFVEAESMEKSYNKEYGELFNPQIIEELYGWMNEIMKKNTTETKKKVLIFGISGTVGQELGKELKKNNSYAIYGTYYKNKPDIPEDKLFQFDIGDLEKLDVILEEINPDIVVSAIRGDYEKQLIFHEKLADYLKKNKGTLYFCSTVGVFEKDISKAHYEDDIYSAETDYGKFKVKCEELLKKILKENLCIFRFSQVWGKNTPRTEEVLKKIENNEEIETYTNLYMNRTTEVMLAKQMSYIITNNMTGIFHLGTDDLMSDTDFISGLLEKLGYEDIKIKEITMKEEGKKYYFAVFSKNSPFPENLRFKNIDVIKEITED